ERPKNHIAMTYVPRRVVSSLYGLHHSYTEVRCCLARRGEDEERLKRGEVPALPESYYQSQAVRIHRTPIINLLSLSPDFFWASILGIEVHPESGEILSLRWSRMPLAALLLGGSPVEQIGVRDALSRA